ncbi:FHA domain-containing protein [Saccharopolyspora erythraea]|uniref:FHA domain-containing protein n=1 Tax=Saccharopolyspora erythraea TaxID=1836 RepID=UPI001BA966DD|nr:FHA domain-containing protein [Saccharopolyspora erythraea]QUH03275.1 FHA domain-containing protein [Saccharopolyspora erythraea]
MTRTRSDVLSPADTTGVQATRPGMVIPAARPSEDLVGAPQTLEVGDSAWLVVNRGPDKGSGFAITSATTTIGRHRECDIVLDDVTVSRFHAELVRQDGRYFLADGGSLNGTYLNRRPVDWKRLADGDEIWIGKVRFTFHIA